VSRKTFGPKRKKVTEEWETIANEELHGLYFLRITDNGREMWHISIRRGTQPDFWCEIRKKEITWKT